MKKTLAVVSLTVFIDMLGFGILVPLVPLLIVSEHSAYTILPVDVSVQLRYILLGVLIALFPLTQLFATPILGDISDTIGRKKVLLFSIIGTCLSYVLVIIGIETRSIILILVARALDGVSGGNLSVAQAVIADISSKESRARNFAILSAAFGLGFVMGPIIGTRLQTMHVLTPFIAALVLSILNILCISLFLEETRKIRTNAQIRWTQAVKHMKHALQMKGVRLYFAINFFLQGAFATLTAFLSVFVIERSNLSSGQFGFVLSYLGVWMVVGQVVLTKIVVKRFGELQGFYISLLGLSISTISLLFAHSFFSFLFLTPCIAIFLGLSQVFLLSLLSSSVGSSEQGEVLGINTSVTAIAQTLPPVLGGLAAAAVSPAMPIVCAAVSSFCASLILRRRVKKLSLNTV